MKKGCLGIGGGIIAVVGLLIVAFGAFLTYTCIDGVESRRAQSDAEWAAYVADSANINSQYRDIERKQAEAYERGDTIAAEQLADSLIQYQEPTPFRGGENIGAAFGMAILIVGLVPLVAGSIMLIIYFASRPKKMSH